jgi:ABC-2 type transport system ATP-binding protein
MSIRIQNVTKLYGSQKAVDNISFEIGEGEIVGFLGPNGAGKSTTMKIITGFIPPTEGLVDVCGFDVLARPRKVKNITGYLPENNPLYTDMYVHEYLRFVGKVYGLEGKKLDERVQEMIGLCGLTPEQNKKIENLSKGYRQRVGLAQALIHDPKVLVLDEPTSGLDPNQLADIRKLIVDISLNKTVIFSTHIMQEVEAICDRVILINRGTIIADDSLPNLMKAATGQLTIIAEFETDIDPEMLRQIPGVEEVKGTGPKTYQIKSAENKELRAAIFRFAADKNLALVGLRQTETSLESVFQELTR